MGSSYIQPISVPRFVIWKEFLYLDTGLESGDGTRFALATEPEADKLGYGLRVPTSAVATNRRPTNKSRIEQLISILKLDTVGTKRDHSKAISLLERCLP